MGKNLHTQNDSNNVYSYAFHKTSELLFKRMINPLLAPYWIFKRTKIYAELNKTLNIIHELMESVIKERAEFLRLQQQNSTSREKSTIEEEESFYKKHRKTLIDTLLTEQIGGTGLNFEDVRNEVNTFVFAGVDTTTAAMCFILYAAAKYPKEQQKLWNELKDFQLTQRQPESLQELNSLEYMDMFIKECLRMFTVVPVTGRQTTTETKIGNLVLPSGVTVWINMYGLAHDCNYFENPSEFRPERFAKNVFQKINPFCYIPFSGGPHVCIGRKYSLMIMKCLLLQLLQRFEIILQDPNEELILMTQMVLKSLNGIHLKFKAR